MLPQFYQPRTPPKQHQAEALEAGWEREGFAYLLEMGLGKSRVAIDDFCLNHAAGVCDALLVIAPKSVYTNWTREDASNPGELARWLWSSVADTTQTHTYRSGRRDRDADARAALLEPALLGPRILVVNVEALASTTDAFDLCARFLKAHRAMIVLDESTVAKNPSAARTKLLLKLAALAVRRRILTGSPVAGSQADLWAQFEFLRPGKNLLGHTRFVTFRARYCRLRELYVNGRTIKTEIGPQNTEELAALVARHSIRKRKMECLDLEPKQYHTREVEMTDEQWRVYREMKKQAMAEVAGGEVTTQIVMTQLMRMYQIVCGHVTLDDGRVVELPTRRLDALDETIEEAGDAQMVIWSAWRPDVDRIVRHLSERHGGRERIAQWHGGIGAAEMEAGELAFQGGDRHFMVATQSAGARGRTWTRGNCVFYYSNHPSVELREQSEDRTHRMGTVGTVDYWDAIATGTREDQVVQALKDQRSLAAAVLKDGLGAWI